MKTNVFRWLAIAAAVLSVAACKLDDDSFDPSIMNPSALVTVKTDADNSSFWMQLDDNTVLHAVNLKKSPFGAKEVRALVNYRRPTAEEFRQGGLQDDANNVYVNWIDSILTKKAIPAAGKDAGRNAFDVSLEHDPVVIFHVVYDGEVYVYLLRTAALNEKGAYAAEFINGFFNTFVYAQSVQFRKDFRYRTVYGYDVGKALLFLFADAVSFEYA